MKNTTPTILYISYDGMLEPLGQSQVLGYLEKLSGQYRISLISFEKCEDRRNSRKMREMHSHMTRNHILWKPLAYHKKPSAVATAYDIAIGTLVALWIAFRQRTRIVHARSYVPALISMIVKKCTGAKFVFDMRGFWADERVDGGLWPADGRLYRITKALERKFLEAADHVVTLTNASESEIATFPYLRGKMPPLSVIPTCANLANFRPSQRVADASRFSLGYLGSVGTWYLFDQFLEFYRAIANIRPDAHLIVVNRKEHDFIRNAVIKAGIDSTRLEIVSAEHKDVPRYVAQMTVGTAIIKPVYSKISSAPTKLAEYLGCGVPCVGNINVGDMESILEGERVGVALRGFSESDHAEAAERLLKLLEDPGLKDRCVNTADRLFSLESGVESYRQIYRSLS